MSDENIKKEDKKPTTDTTGQPATPTTAPESEKKDVTITVKHEFETKKPADVPSAEKPAEKSAEKPTETPKVETPTETPKEKELREKLEEREGQLTTLALKAFEDEKNALLAKVTDPEKKSYVEKFIGDDPSKLEQVRFMTGIIKTAFEQEGAVVKDPTKTETKPPEKKPEEPEGDGTEKVPPVGVVKAPPAVPTGNVTTQVIDELFAILADPSKSQAEKDKANQKVNEMYGEFRRGAKEGGKKDSYPLPPTMACPKCGAVMQGMICQTCGYEIPKIQR